MSDLLVTALLRLRQHYPTHYSTTVGWAEPVILVGAQGHCASSLIQKAHYARVLTNGIGNGAGAASFA